jgi:hypothetical protein
LRLLSAVLIELAFDGKLTAEAPYRGEVEFLTKEEWATELDSLLDDLQTQDGRAILSVSDPQVQMLLIMQSI